MPLWLARFAWSVLSFLSAYLPLQCFTHHDSAPINSGHACTSAASFTLSCVVAASFASMRGAGCTSRYTITLKCCVSYTWRLGRSSDAAIVQSRSLKMNEAYTSLSQISDAKIAPSRFDFGNGSSHLYIHIYSRGCLSFHNLICPSIATPDFKTQYSDFQESCSGS